MDCKLCHKEIGERYVTLIARTPQDTFNICWECWGWVSLDKTDYHPSIHDDGPPEGTQ